MNYCDDNMIFSKSFFFFFNTVRQMNSNMDSNLTESTLDILIHLVSRVRNLEQQIDYLQALNSNLQAAYADLSAYNNYLLRSFVNSPDPDAVPTVFEDEEQPNKRLRGESSDELRVEPLEQSFIDNSDGSASGEETNSLLEDNRSEESDGFLRSLFEENPLEENPLEENPLRSLFGENSLRLGEERVYLQPADE